MRILKSFIIAFSMYSQIPMPQFEWKEEDMKYMLCFFPLVGAVIGLCLYGWEKLCMGMEINGVCRTLVGTAIPLLLTGGIHVDGYMDTMDAFHSYQSRERKIEILKDPHIGAFSVIMLAAYGLLYAGGYAQLENLTGIKIIGMGFALSRCLSAVGFLSLCKKRRTSASFCFQCGKENCKRNFISGNFSVCGRNDLAGSYGRKHCGGDSVCSLLLLWVSL